MVPWLQKKISTSTAPPSYLSHKCKSSVCFSMFFFRSETLHGYWLACESHQQEELYYGSLPTFCTVWGDLWHIGDWGAYGNQTFKSTDFEGSSNIRLKPDYKPVLEIYQEIYIRSLWNLRVKYFKYVELFTV